MDNEPQVHRYELHSVSPANIILTSGALLIVVAVFVLASTSWESFSPVSRILTSLIPLIILYAIGFGLRKQAAHHVLSQVTLITGSIILPITLGITIYQSGLYPFVDATLVFGVALVSLIWYGFLEFVLAERWQAIGTIVASSVLAVSFGEIVNLPNWGYYLLAIILAFFYLCASRTYISSYNSTPPHLAAWYSGTAIILGTCGLVLLPPTFTQWANLGSVSDIYTLILYILAAAILFAVAVLFSREWQETKSPLDLALRQLTEQLSVLVLGGAAILIGLTSNETDAIIITILIGIAALILGAYVRITLLRPIGLVALVIGLLKLILFAATQVGAAWPILLLVVGFILIGIAYIAQTEHNTDLWKRLLKSPNESSSLFGLGIIPEQSHSNTHAKVNPNLNGTAIVWIAAFLIFMIVITFVASISPHY